MIKMDAKNPGIIFIVSTMLIKFSAIKEVITICSITCSCRGVCVLVYGVLSVLLYTNSADHVDHLLANVLFQGKLICCFGFVQAVFGCLTMLCDIIKYNRYMSFTGFVLWTVWILLNMLNNTYLAYNYEMGWSWRFVLSVLFAVPWALTVKRQLELHRQLIREGDTRRRN